MKRFVLAASVALSALCAVSPAQALVVGTADTTSSIPFSNSGYAYYFQQVYNASSFGAGLDISRLTFYSSTPGGTVRTGTFQIYLSTISSAISIPNFDNTDGTTVPWYDASFTEVFNGELPVLADGRLDFDLSTVFNYDTTKGNLLLTIREFSLSGSTTAYFDADKNTGTTNMRFSAYAYPYFDQGLVTGFNDGVAAVPEPATWAMMIGGFALAGAAMRRRNAAVSFA